MATETRRGQGPFTVADVLSTPEDHVKRELIDGWLYVEGQLVDSLDAIPSDDDVTAPRLAHQDAVGELFVAFRAHALDTGAKAYVAPVDVVFGEVVLQPDVLLVAAEDVAALAGAARLDGVIPALLVEVSSPSTRSYDLLRKRRIYEDAVVPEVWFVDLEAERVEVYRLEGEGYRAPTVHERGARVVSRAAPGLDVAVDEVLPDSGRAGEVR